jgi:predicted membrane channel-forming protein YqfA (hemolysin III family)
LPVKEVISVIALLRLTIIKGLGVVVQYGLSLPHGDGLDDIVVAVFLLSVALFESASVILDSLRHTSPLPAKLCFGYVGAYQLVRFKEAMTAAATDFA